MKDEKYIVNPMTGRVVLRDGKIGRNVLNTSSKQDIIQLDKLLDAKRYKKINVSDCDYGYIYSSKYGKKCHSRKSPQGIAVVKCQQNIVKKKLSDFKKNTQFKKGDPEYSQQLTIALTQSKKFC